VSGDQPDGTRRKGRLRTWWGALTRHRGRFGFAVGLLAGAGVATLVAVLLPVVLAPATDLEPGELVILSGRDDSNGGQRKVLIDQWNALHPANRARIEELPGLADAQHSEMVARAQSGSDPVDIYNLDVTAVAEFAHAGYLRPVQVTDADTAGFLAAPLATCRYQGKLWGLPFNSDAGLLFYRKDLVPTPPTTWSELISDCSKKTSGMNCYGGQFSQYEGLTCNAVEAIYGAGGSVVKSDGKTPDVDTPQAAQGLSFLVNGFKQGYIPHEAITYTEEPSREAFQGGKLLFLRNWPYVYAHLTGDANSKVKDKFGVAPLPGMSGQGTSTLGGHSAAISVYSKHQATAFDFLKFIETPDIQLNQFLKVGTLAPVLKAPYSDASAIAKFPYLPTLEKSIDTAIPRPVSPFYPAITQSIQTNVYQALQGSLSVDAALKNIQEGITKAAGG
jgi:multiple sugar transport system substrate-binding protein